MEAIALAQSHPLSNDDIERLAPGVGVMTYEEAFDRNTDLHELLARYPQRAIIFLYQSREGYGHWIALFERNGALYVCDSYGGYPDSWGRFVSTTVKRRLGESAPYLLRAISHAYYPHVYWNEYPLQYHAPDIQTCGRWAVARVLNCDLGIEDFAQLAYTVARDIDMSTDEMVCAWVV